jgi:acetyl-CoA carboxylase carboxyltransferase component
VEEVGGRPVVLVSVDPTDRRGALSGAAGHKLAAAADAARAADVPLVGFLGSSGSDIGEGVPALHGWGEAARALVRCSGIVPVVLVVVGPAVSGPALLLGLADHVVMTEAAYAFVSGPRMVRDFTGVTLGNDALGGPWTHARSSGVASLLVRDEGAAREAVEHLLALLPSNNDEEPPRWPTGDPADRATPEAGAALPATTTGSYDVRSVARAVVDDGELLEVREWWAPNLVTGFATLGERPVGIVANQPLAVAGTLDIPASQKGARFVAFCDAFNLPIVTLVDTPGFYPGKDLEWRGMIRHGAELAFAYARATVPRLCVVLRKSYGGAYIVMDSRNMGNDLYLSWPNGEIAVMGAKGAVEILHRRESPEVRAELEAAYEERFLTPYIAASRGSVDAVIDPADTRRHLTSALEAIVTKREHLVKRKHDNQPL